MALPALRKVKFDTRCTSPEVLTLPEPGGNTAVHIHLQRWSMRGGHQSGEQLGPAWRRSVAGVWRGGHRQQRRAGAWDQGHRERQRKSWVHIPLVVLDSLS